jgi:enoyl-[acyl-carrier protein] reductase II
MFGRIVAAAVSVDLTTERRGTTVRATVVIWSEVMLVRTGLCALLGVDVPVIQASLGPWSSVELAAAVSNAGGLGSLGTAVRSADAVRDDIARMRELTDRPFAVNHTFRPLDEQAFAFTLEARPVVVSVALGDPKDLVARVHDAGSLFMQQIHTVEQAKRVADDGVDVIIAQGGEAGGFGGTVSTMVLVPQVVDAVDPIPVVAAGGIADGRGLAAALVLGAQGINIGTRFLASTEASTVADSWRQAILQAQSQDAVKVEFANAVLPPLSPGGFTDARPRVLQTPFVEHWNQRLDAVAQEAERLRAEVMAAVGEGRLHELVPFTGQSVGLVRDVLPAGEIVRRLVAAAEAALAATAGPPIEGKGAVRA